MERPCLGNCFDRQVGWPVSQGEARNTLRTSTGAVLLSRFFRFVQFLPAWWEELAAFRKAMMFGHLGPIQV